MGSGDPEEEADGAYNWILYMVRRLVQWASFWVGGVGTLLIFWFHWGNAYKEYGVKWYDAATAGACYKAAATTAKPQALVMVGCMLTPTKVCTYADVMCPTASVVATTGICNSQTPPASELYCAKDTTTWCRVKCVGSCKVKEEPQSKNGLWDCGALSDNNKDWRKIFTFKPNDFLDMFTPIALGGVEFLQHLGKDYISGTISGTWVVRALWLFALSLFGQFGYAGDLGVLCGYIMDFAVVLPCVALAIFDHQMDKATGFNLTTAQLLPTLKWVLELCGAEGLCPGLATVQAQEATTGIQDAPAEQNPQADSA